MARILVIDDDEDVRAVLRGVLEQAGHEVVVAANGVEGIDAFRRLAADLVITDIVMPEKEGIETIRDLVEEFPNARIVAMSGGGKRLNRDNALFTASEIGAYKILRKPFEPSELLSSVQMALASPR
jgi:CheY-like chemotaxis protein